MEWSELLSNYCLDIDVLCIHLFLNYTVSNINLVQVTIRIVSYCEYLTTDLREENSTLREK